MTAMANFSYSVQLKLNSVPCKFYDFKRNDTIHACFDPRLLGPWFFFAWESVEYLPLKYEYLREEDSVTTVHRRPWPGNRPLQCWIWWRHPTKQNTTLIEIESKITLVSIHPYSSLLYPSPFTLRPSSSFLPFTGEWKMEDEGGWMEKEWLRTKGEWWRGRMMDGEGMIEDKGWRLEDEGWRMEKEWLRTKGEGWRSRMMDVDERLEDEGRWIRIKGKWWMMEGEECWVKKGERRMEGWRCRIWEWRQEWREKDGGWLRELWRNGVWRMEYEGWRLKDGIWSMEDEG